jgi:hypothetical protein
MSGGIARARAAFLAMALLAPAAAHAQAGNRLAPLLFQEPVNLELGYTRDDNVNRGRESELRMSDGIFVLNASHGRAWPLGTTRRLEVTGLLGGEKFARHHGLSRISAGAEAVLQYRASGAFDATTIGLVGRATYEQFKSRLRDGPRYFLGLSAQRAVTDRIDVFAEIGASLRHGQSEVFNGRDYAAKLNLSYALRAGYGTLYLTGEYRGGDSVSTGGPSLVNVDLAEVLVPDDAFPGRELFAYQLDVRTVLGTLGWNYPLGPRAAIDLSWRGVRSTPTGRPGFDESGPLRYVDNQYSIAYLRRF